jgi:hypothetical protein
VSHGGPRFKSRLPNWAEKRRDAAKTVLHEDGWSHSEGRINRLRVGTKSRMSGNYGEPSEEMRRFSHETLATFRTP